jgi:hypothetical protein
MVWFPWIVRGYCNVETAFMEEQQCSRAAAYDQRKLHLQDCPRNSDHYTEIACKAPISFWKFSPASQVATVNNQTARAFLLEQLTPPFRALIFAVVDEECGYLEEANAERSYLELSLTLFALQFCLVQIDPSSVPITPPLEIFAILWLSPLYYRIYYHCIRKVKVAMR